jgi:predicted GH43/DUF377 family glycosyl hydrolase
MNRVCLWMLSLMLLCTAVALGNPPAPGSAVKILPPRRFPGWQAQNVCYPFVITEADGSYRMYYTGSASEQWNDSVAEQWVTGYVTSTDTLTWAFPENYEQVLFARKLMEGDLVDPGEQAAIFDSMYASGACVVREGGTYKVWYTGWNGQTEHAGGGISRKINFRIGYATSPDGTRWTKVAGSAGAGAVLGLGAGGSSDGKGVAHPHVLKIGSTYRMWYEGYEGTTWRIFAATSDDGVVWTKTGVVLSPGGSGSLDQLGLRNPMVLFRNSRYELWYQGQRSSAPNYHVLRATSTDAVSWAKVSGEVTLHPSPAISGDESVLVDSAIVLPDNSVQVFFARQETTTRSVTYATLSRKSFNIYTEVVSP